MEYRYDAIEEEREKYTEEDYNDMLRECYGDTIEICGKRYDSAYALKEIDPIAYNYIFSDYQKHITIYKCPICDDEYETERGALDCCPENAKEEDQKLFLVNDNWIGSTKFEDYHNLTIEELEELAKAFGINPREFQYNYHGILYNGELIARWEE